MLMIIFLINAGGKLNALARIASFIGLSKRRTLMNAFFINLVIGPLFGCVTAAHSFHERCSRFIFNVCL